MCAVRVQNAIRNGFKFGVLAWLCGGALLAGLAVQAHANDLIGAPIESKGGLRSVRACGRSRICDPRGLTFRTLVKGVVAAANIRPLLPRLTAIAGAQADLWSDTILEGPFDAESLVVLDSVEGVYRRERLIAYRITYSSRAWRVDSAGVRLEEGRIVESAYVSISLNGFFRDERAVAEFRTSI